MVLDTNVMGAAEDPEPPTDELSSIDTPGSIWLSLGPVGMSDPDSQDEGAHPQREVATGLLPLHDTWAQRPDSNSGDNKAQEWSIEYGFSTDVRETNNRRQINPPRSREMEAAQSDPNYQLPCFTWARTTSSKSDMMHAPPPIEERDAESPGSMGSGSEFNTDVSETRYR